MLVQASPLAIVALDASWNVKMWSPAAERMFGWSEQEHTNLAVADAEAMMKKPVSERRLGLLGMRERVALVGGTLDIESTPAPGATVLVHIRIT
jgi:PAS domain S-box-containing protein